MLTLLTLLAATLPAHAADCADEKGLRDMALCSDAQDDAHDAAIDSLDAAAVDAATAIGALEADVTAIDRDVDRLFSRMGSAERRITTLEGRVGAISRDLGNGWTLVEETKTVSWPRGSRQSFYLTCPAGKMPIMGDWVTYGGGVPYGHRSEFNGPRFLSAIGRGDERIWDFVVTTDFAIDRYRARIVCIDKD